MIGLKSRGVVCARNPSRKRPIRREGRHQCLLGRFVSVRLRGTPENIRQLWRCSYARAQATHFPSRCKVGVQRIERHTCTHSLVSLVQQPPPPLRLPSASGKTHRAFASSMVSRCHTLLWNFRSSRSGSQNLCRLLLLPLLPPAV